jgi:hypothetical protein
VTFGLSSWSRVGFRSGSVRRDGGLGLKLRGDGICAESVDQALGAQKLLLVLNNCERVIDAAAKLAESVNEPGDLEDRGRVRLQRHPNWMCRPGMSNPTSEGSGKQCLTLPA